MCTAQAGSARRPYAMYVLGDDMFESKEDNSRSSICGLPEAVAGTPGCVSSAWDSMDKLADLWAACTIPGRKINRIFFSKLPIDGEECDPRTEAVLEGAHARNIEVYMLFAENDAVFSTRLMVQSAVAYNARCPTHRFDGIAIRNEYFSSVRCGLKDIVAETDFLVDLHAAKENAGNLPLHFSVSWIWAECAGLERRVTYPLVNGVEKGIGEHMLGLVDSVDVQVGWSIGDEMARRAERYFYEYHVRAKRNSKDFYVLAYTNPLTDCRRTFFPHGTSGCEIVNKPTQEGLWEALDEVERRLPLARGVIYYYGMAYASNLPGWPKLKGL